MRLIRFLIALLFVAAGVLIGALNPRAIVIDLGFVELPATLGVALLVSVLIGVVLGGLMLSVSLVLPLRQQLRRTQVRQATLAASRDDDGRI
jgi:lipopolysaccharide assembly protein A